MIRLLPVAFLALAATSSPALAQEQVAPDRIINLMVFGDDACPEPANEEEIVVCARQPESDRYRVPRRFRDRSDTPMEVSWGARAMDLEDAQRDTRGGGCSVNGFMNQMGCTQQMIREWYADRRARARENERNR